MIGDYQGFRLPLVQDVYKKSAAATNEELKVGPVDPGYIWIVNWFAVEDETTAYTYLRGLIAGGGKDHYLFEERSPLAARLYWSSVPIYVPEGRYLVARLNGTTSGDVLRMYVEGFKVYQVEKGRAHAESVLNA
jgi:hypothetical protein